MYRQPKELEEFLEAAKDHGIRGRTVESSSFDPDNTDMVLQARILVAFAAKESDDKAAGSLVATLSCGRWENPTGPSGRLASLRHG